MCKFCDVDMSEGGFISETLDSGDKSIFLFTLHRFLNDKLLAVEEMAEKSGDVIASERGYHHVLSTILDGEDDYLYHVHLYSEWLDSKHKSRYKIKNSLPDDYVSRFEDNVRGLRMTLARNTRAENFEYQDKNKLPFDNSTLFAISRQASDVEKPDVTGPQRRRDLRYVFLEVKEDAAHLVISTRSKGIRDTLLTKAEEIFSILTTDADIVDDETELSKTRFEEELEKPENNEPDKIKILSIDFRDTNTQPSVPLSLSNKSARKEVRPVVNRLGQEIVNVNIANIKKLWFSHEGVDVSVRIERNLDQSFVRLNANIKTRSELKSDEVKTAFKEQFGLPLNQKIPLYWITRDRTDLISQMLKGMGYWQTKYVKDDDLLTSLVGEIKVLNKSELERRQCIGCENFYKRKYNDGCPNCGNELKVFDTSFELGLSTSGVRKYLKDKLENEGLSYHGVKREKIYGNEFKLIQIGNGKSLVRVLINNQETNLTAGTIKYLRKSIHPILVVNPGKTIDETLIKETTANIVDLSELINQDLYGSLPDDYISARFEEVVRNAEKQASDNALDSFNNIKNVIENPDDHRGEEFEQDAFHILNQIIPTLQQWGSKRRGNQPDGFGELTFFKGDKTYFRSFAFDAKFTSKTDIAMDSKEAGTLSDYALRIYKSDEVKRSDTVFQNFIVITNAAPGNFGAVGANKLNRMRSWDGVPVLMHSNFLLYLHKAYNENIEALKNNLHIFHEELYLTLNGGKMYHQNVDRDFYVHLNEDEAEELFERLNEKIVDSGINIPDLRSFLEEDILPV
ncbi:hypothetical protein SAMN05216559_1990 [Halomicrobium zhouii]|uniref:Uncharacterized protein n=2 Tax=Halomicrobium zhouii TaxID=767519 RepID=A0A1I6L435_9EURY|nr:hypothetical protein SAMN05216559_1990 [Halomicrobium zhouii]